MKYLRLLFTRYPAVTILIVAALALSGCLRFGIIDQGALIANLTRLHETYGLQALFISSLVEGFLFFGIYYTGSIFIIAAVLLAQGDIVALLQIILTVWSALTIMCGVNFIIGKYDLVSMQVPKLPTSRWATALLYLHPTLIAYQAYSRGHDGRSYRSLLPISFGIFVSGVFYATTITLVAWFFNGVLYPVT